MKTSKQVTHLTPIIIIHYSCICKLILSKAFSHFVQEWENQKNSGEIHWKIESNQQWNKKVLSFQWKFHLNAHQLNVKTECL